MKNIAAIAAAVSVGVAGLCVPRTAFAAENGALAYAPGVSSTFVGLFPPVPGLFVLNQTSVTPAAHVYGADGHKLPIPFETEAQVNATRFIASWPDTAFGARLYSQLIFPVANLNTTAFGRKDDELGLQRDRRPDHLQLEARRRPPSRWASTSRPSSAATATAGRSTSRTNYRSFRPVLAYRYDDPTGFTFGVGNRFLINMENRATRYASEADSEAGWSFWQAEALGGGQPRPAARGRHPVRPAGSRRQPVQDPQCRPGRLVRFRAADRLGETNPKEWRPA
ncbi:hypothetical protein LRS73_33330 (plasmid) [Methylobacterium currus]|uniref:hypothetical protein n=1 Tax=Methylobacterium currus TaxID=2051553 RepID=UPI001E54A57E|nr:hypothetical protein [Methylobacterium currus]UHC19882.1 hypothetical protein LRS73_33330 [Methylobacterium currus]